MHTGTHTIQVIVGQERRLIVPLYQRPYVWNQEEQWEKNVHRRWTLAFSQEIAFERHARASRPPRARACWAGCLCLPAYAGRRFRRRPARTF